MPKMHKIIQSFNAGELSPLMDSRIDQQKYAAGCRTMENFIPLIYGGAQKRPGLEYIASQKTSSAKGRVVAFEHSVDDTYILLFENQVIRLFKDGSQVTDSVGSEDLSALDNIVAHWTLNDNLATQNVLDDDGNTHDGTTVTNNTEDLTVTGKVGSGAFDLDGLDAVVVSDHNDFSFDDTSNEPFSITAWCFVTDAGIPQTILSKWQAGTAREWKFSIDADRKLKLELFDDSTGLEGDRVAHWKLNDDAANTAVDDDVASIPHDGVASANTNTLTAAGKIGKCLDFGGSASVVVSDHAELSFAGGGGMSASAWIYHTITGSTQVILAKFDTDTPDREWQFNIALNGALEFNVYDEANNKLARKYQNANTMTQNQWHHVVGTYDGATGNNASDGITLYIDGSAVTSDVTSSTDAGYNDMVAGAEDVVIGARRLAAGVTLNFADKIDNVILFNKELSAAEVTSLWNNGNGAEDLFGASPSRLSDSALSTGWNFVAATYSAADGGGSTAASDIVLYVNGSSVSSTGTEDSGYTAMENTAADVYIGAFLDSGSNIEDVWQDKIDNVAIFSDVLSSGEISGLYSTETFEITSPYLTADLPSLKFEQSADVMFITHPSYEPRKLSRTGDTEWTLEALDLQTGPFRDQNTDTTKTITASATTGSVTLTAAGHSPFVPGTVAGHLPSGSLDTSKSQTGALFRLVHAAATSNISDLLVTNVADDATATLAVAKGVTWDFTTNGTWGTAANPATIVLERTYDSGTTYETVHSISSAANKNVTTSGTEEIADALYRVRVSDVGGDASTATIQLSIRDTSHIGIVEITAVATPQSATATVLTTLGSTDLTHRWSEGSFSNFRGWPIDVTISSEERLTFAGNISEPLTTWGSVIGDFTDFKTGTDDDDALILTLVGSGQQNRVRWMLSKNTLVLGTVGGEHILGASKDDEALTPSNIRARLQTTYGSENIAAKIINQAVLFVQRGGRKIREFLYNFEQDSHKADDLTVFSEHITESGIVDMAFQRTPDPMLWCVRDDGQMAIMTYERDQNVFSWARFVTHTNLAGTESDSDFESVAVIYGGAGNEDEVWVTVRRTIDGSDARYVERFFQREMPSSIADMKYLDSYITDIGGDTTITGLSHLEGQTVQVLGDGLVQATKVVSSGQITAATTAAKYQVGIGYTATVKPMKLDLQGMGLTVTKKINRGLFSVFETIGGEVGGSASTLQDIPTGTAALFTGSKEIPLKDGYSREGDILARQTQPLPMTVLSFQLDVGANAD